MSITEKIIEIFKQNVTNAGDVELNAESVIREEMEIDSLEMMLVISEIESEFGVEIPNEKIGTIITVQDAVDCVESIRNGENV